MRPVEVLVEDFKVGGVIAEASESRGGELRVARLDSDEEVGK